MRLEALGHAGLKLEAGRATVLVDPWFSPRGAFQASWFQFPENSQLLTPELLRPSAIVISHEHLDHVDPWFLARVPSSVPVFVPRYPSPVLRRKLESAGPRPIVEVPAWERVEVADGVEVVFVTQESPMHHDAAIVLFAGGRTVLDMNDAKLSPVQLRTIRGMAGGVVDAFAFQGSGASWYPVCYRYPRERMAQLSRKKRASKLAFALGMVRVVEPVVALPFAGPACFLDPDLFRHNAEMEDGVFPDQEQVAVWLRERSVGNAAVLLPGDAWDLDARIKDPDPAWADFSFADRWPYLESYAERRRPEIEALLAEHPVPEESLWAPFRDYFGRMLGMSPYFNGRIGMPVGFDVRGPGGGRWTVDFRPGCEAVVPEPRPSPYRLSFDSRWLPGLLDGSTPWEDFFLSLRFEAERDPDHYNAHLTGLLKFAEPAALEAVERFETSLDLGDRIVVHAEGRSYSVNRHCPHAGNDLEVTGEVLPGRVLRCTAHGYEFDLESGGCLNCSGMSLDVEPID